MIIIVEGPDGSGKSTLAADLKRSHPNSTLVHFGKPESEREAYDYWRVYADSIKEADPSELTIFDRSWYSDLVYGPIFRNRTEMDPLHVLMLEALVQTSGGGLVIHCTAPLKTLWARCRKRGETYVTSRDQLQMLAKKYDEVFREYCRLPLVRHNT